MRSELYCNLIHFGWQRIAPPLLYQARGGAPAQLGLELVQLDIYGV